MWEGFLKTLISVLEDFLSQNDGLLVFRMLLAHLFKIQGQMNLEYDADLLVKILNLSPEKNHDLNTKNFNQMLSARSPFSSIDPMDIINMDENTRTNVTENEERFWRQAWAKVPGQGSFKDVNQALNAAFNHLLPILSVYFPDTKGDQATCNMN